MGSAQYLGQPVSSLDLNWYTVVVEMRTVSEYRARAVWVSTKLTVRFPQLTVHISEYDRAYM